MPGSITYTFEAIEKCNMCGSDGKTHRVLGKRLNQPQGRKPKGKIGISTTVMQCTTCSLIYANPMPIPANIQDHYGVAPEEYWTESYFEDDPLLFGRELDKLKTLMKIEPGYKSLDIGAGIGKIMKALEMAGFDGYGLEPSEPFYKRAIEKVGIKPEKIKMSTVEEAEYPANHFDFITLGVVLEHLYHPSEVLEKVVHWLKPGGIIHVEVPSSKWLVSKIINTYYTLTCSEYVGNISPMHVPFHLYEFGLESFAENAKKNKYEIAAHEYFVCPTYLPKIFDGILRSYMAKTDTGMQLIVWLRKK
jgi:2-polyprenyl-3-methyl-5-hydroxy-6-metoxy-1,4-benzoquinol methylase